MTAPSGPSTTDAQTFMPIGSPVSVPRAVSLPVISCPSSPSLDVPSPDGHDQACLSTLPTVPSVDHSSCVPSPALPNQQDVPALPPVPSMELSPSQPSSMLPINTCIVMTPTVRASGHISESPTLAPTVQDPTSSILVSNGGDEDYSPPSCPPSPMPPMEDSMVVDSLAHPPPPLWSVPRMHQVLLCRMPWAPLIAVKDVREIHKWTDQNIAQFVRCFLSNNFFFCHISYVSSLLKHVQPFGIYSCNLPLQ